MTGLGHHMTEFEFVALLMTPEGTSHPGGKLNSAAVNNVTASNQVQLEGRFRLQISRDNPTQHNNSATYHSSDFRTLTCKQEKKKY